MGCIDTLIHNIYTSHPVRYRDSRAIKNFKHVLTVNNKKQTKTIQKYLVFPVPNFGKYFYFPLLGSQFFEEKKARCELLN